MKRQECFTIEDISSWRNNIDVNLPNVQRGFVWKPSQIENLWDSLLRGYPVGAIVLSQKTAKQKTKNDSSISKPVSFELLDGQQRVTAIRLGFGTDTFRHSERRFKIFIDLAPPTDNNLKYQFRVITSSHPWGYQRKDNTKTLDADNIKKARELYGIDDHLKFLDKLDNFFPYDADLPVPFEFFVNAKNSKELLKKIVCWEHWGKISKNSKSQIRLESRIDELFKVTKEMLAEVKVPALYLDYSKLEQNNQKTNAKFHNNDGDDDDDEGIDEVENLFIRLNAGGTPLRGEELNYSVLKARIDRNLQNIIEGSCAGLLAPARFITIAYRLYQHRHETVTNDAISMRIKPKQFQKTMAVNERDFKSFLEDVLGSKKFGKRTLLEQAKYILSYDKDNNSNGFPYLIYSKLASEAPEVMFMLLYRLLIMEDRLDPRREGDETHQRMLGIISLFLWFGKGENLRDHSKLLYNIWPAVKGLKPAALFWSSSTIQRAQLNNVLLPVPSSNTLISFGDPRANVDILTKAGANEDFFRKMFFERDLILYAQRDALAKWFIDQHYGLDDTNVPFDWDHISPNKFCRNQKKIPKAVKAVYHSNGNFRAWPYSLNRFDQDDVPAKKLNPLAKENLSDKDATEKADKLLEHLNNRYNMRLSRTSEKGLRKVLLDWSSCSNEWLKCDVTNLKDDWKKVFKLIMHRNFSICNIWYQSLKIDSLIPDNTDIVSKILDKRRWKKNCDPKYLKKLFGSDYNYDTYWLYEVGVSDNYVHIYFGYESGEELTENGIDFGIVGNNMNEFLGNKSPEKIGDSVYEYGERWIGSSFTLISNDNRSYVELFANIKNWLEKFPNKCVYNFSAIFIQSLSQKIQNGLLGNGSEAL